ncbi:transposase, partial [Noviherbaspirillum sp. ST9]|uniref:transposase n=1 Tax=Noviherbaspirillum sp. ST9 TaxID=3401606 RepID=UPI003B5869BD
MLIARGFRKPRTTQSNHLLRRYPDLAKHLLPDRSEQFWVSDITFICIGYSFNYLSLVTDAYSKRIMGYCLHPYLTNDGSINALKMALQNRSYHLPLIHHSDRGVQYCSYDYIILLNEHKIGISMTQHGEAYENPIAERINGILKTEFKLGEVFRSRTEALLAVRRAVEAYNTLRPHMSCSLMTPSAAHQATEPLVKHW